MMDKLKTTLTSRKWWALAIAMLIPLLNKILKIDLNAEETTKIVVPFIVWAIGEFYLDSKKIKPEEKKEVTKEEEKPEK